MAAIDDGGCLRDRGESKIDVSKKRSRTTTKNRDELSEEEKMKLLMKKMKRKLLMAEERFLMAKERLLMTERLLKKMKRKKKKRSLAVEKEFELEGDHNCDLSERISLTALRHFNKDIEAHGGITYEFVEAMHHGLMFEREVWFHVNFKAKLKNAPDSEAVLFFGEVRDQKGIINCCVLNSGDRRGSCKGCNFEDCNFEVIHPPRGFRPGTGPAHCDLSHDELDPVVYRKWWHLL